MKAPAEFMTWPVKNNAGKTSEPLSHVLPLIASWLRERSQNRLKDHEKDIGKLTREDLELLHNRSEGFDKISRSMEARLPAHGPIFSVKGQNNVWDVYFPEIPGESCAIAQLVTPGNTEYKIPWCTARTKNNQFYGYTAQGILLYYVVNHDEPEEKYSLGMIPYYSSRKHL